MVERLIRWAEINSGSANTAGLGRMAETLLQDFKEALPGVDAASRRVGGAASSLSIRRRPDAPLQILCSGHYDTVYGEDHPFQRCRRLNDSTLGGPGVADMKGGIVTLLETLRAFEAALPSQTQLGWHVLLTPDEETGSVASAELLREAARSHHLALVFEPSRPNGNIVRARMGTGILQATCHGRSAHAGRAPAEGRNAIVALSEFLVAADRAARAIPGVLLNIGTVRGGGTVNVVPDLAEADINIRIGRMSDEATLRRALEEAAAPINARDGFRLEITGQLNRPPKEVLPAEEPLFDAYRTCAAQAGVAVDWQDVAGGSDGNILSAAGLPCLDGIGPIGDHLHSAEETVNVPSLVSRAQTAALLLMRLAEKPLAFLTRARPD